jgi:hypothetical protein
MKSSVTFLASLFVVLAAHAAAIAGPGDPRLVNGVIEWPRAVTNEPFLVVRGDDGVLYYVTLAAARRDATLAAGARVAVLGLEGRTSHEISALGVGVGDSVESALANLRGAHPAPVASAPAAPGPPVNGGAAAIAAPNVKAPAVPATAAAPVSPPAPAAVAPAAPAPAPAAAAPAAPAPAPAAAAPAAPAPAPAAAAPSGAAPTSGLTAPAPAVTPPTPSVGPYPAVISAPTAPPALSAAVAPPPPRPLAPEVAPASAPVPATVRDDRRWTEITGVVESMSGRTLVLRSEEGRVAVDMSSLSLNLERILRPGATVRVYGVPVEMRFKAMGFVDPGGRP